MAYYYLSRLFSFTDIQFSRRSGSNGDHSIFIEYSGNYIFLAQSAVGRAPDSQIRGPGFDIRFRPHTFVFRSAD